MPVNSLQLTPPAAGQSDRSAPFLFSHEIIEELTKEERVNGVYTAERLKAQDPNKYEAIIFLRAHDWGEKQIAKLLHVHHRTIAAVDLAEPEAIDTVRARLIRHLRRAGGLQLERLLEHPDSLPMQFAGMTAVQLIDKAELLEGRATARVERVERVDIYGDWDAFMERQLQPGEDVIELPAGTGLVGEKKAAIEAGAPGAGRLAGTDQESDAQSDSAERAGDRATALATDSTADSIAESGRLEPGGEGVRPPEGQPNFSTRNQPQKFSGDMSS